MQTASDLQFRANANLILYNVLLNLVQQTGQQQLASPNVLILNLGTDSTIQNLTTLIARSTNLPESYQNFLHAGRYLNDTKTLTDYSIRDDDTVFLSIKHMTRRWQVIL